MSIGVGIRVLVVEPMVTTSRDIIEICRRLGFSDVRAVQQGGEALRHLQSGDYGLVLAEWDMVPMSGFELLRSVRSDPRTRKLPFVLITSNVEVDKVIAARQEGVSAYLVKPFSPALLQQKLTGIFEKV